MDEQLTFEFEQRPTIKGFPELRWTGKRPYRSTQYYPAQLRESYGEEQSGWINKIFWGDNLQVMSHMLRDFRGKIDLIYIDPPFDSKADYKKQISGRSRARKPAYEEIANTYYEMAGGVSEQEAYENLGARSRLAEYKNLSVLLVQNLKKGRRELIPLLEQEVRTAMEEKRRMARVEGEKAATRLLLPMGMMLLVVLALMMVPAFLSV